MQKELQAELPCRRYSLPALSIEKENKTMTDYPNNIPAKLEIIKVLWSSFFVTLCSINIYL